MKFVVLIYMSSFMARNTRVRIVSNLRFLYKKNQTLMCPYEGLGNSGIMITVRDISPQVRHGIESK